MFVKSGNIKLAVDMYTDLRMWEDARYYAALAEKGGGMTEILIQIRK